ncbi:MAG: DUF4097 family beta strand repeat protein [Actinobacteria bacterium]|nr:DUF4097 family beta strand repeat protein [Actinomycetota bacterium]MBO0834952.1 DUF4097 family beta strand repeat protein [Actinomycetota bacterium]
MTSTQRLILILGLPVVLALIAWVGLVIIAGVGTGTYRVNTALQVNAGTLKTNLHGDGDVTLVQGSSARLTGTITYSLVRPDLTVSGNSVSYRCPMPTGSCSLDSTLSVPPGTGVNLHSGAGDLTVNGGLRSPISLSTAAGDLTANNLAATNAALSTTVGDISASGITSRDVVVHSTAGDITLTFARVPTTVIVNGRIGDVTIILPAGTARYDVQAHSSVGDVSVSSSVPQDVSSPNKITVTSSAGDISIKTS